MMQLRISWAKRFLSSVFLLISTTVNMYLKNADCIEGSNCAIGRVITEKLKKLKRSANQRFLI